MGICTHRTLLVSVVAALLLTGQSIRAHEIGTTRVSVVFTEPGQYEFEIVTDALTLLEKLEGVSGESGSLVRDTSMLRKRLEHLEPIFRQRVVIAFDDQVVRPAISWSVTQADTVGGSLVAAVRLSGDTPRSAEQLTFKYAWTFTPYAFVTRHGLSGPATTDWLEGGEISRPVSLNVPPQELSRLGLAQRYMWLGFTHILPKGIDHVLFVLGIFLLSRRVRPILLQVSAFTLAHSITLALSMYGLVTLPASVVEPAIALSIAYIALENVFTAEFRPRRYALVFAFGLLHGLGFAGALTEVGLPRAEFLTALVGFNAGVELGQLTVVAGAFFSVGYWFSDRIWYRQRVALPASACMALLGIYWTFERLGYAV